MRRSTKRLTWLIAIAVATTACDEGTLAPELDPGDATQEATEALVTALEDITASFGLTEAGSLAGVDESDEAPAFGSDVFAQEFGGPDAPELGDDVADDAELQDVPPDRLQLYNVMALWGRIRPNDADWRGIQWDPALQVAEGDAVRVRREILFDAGDEVHPQEQRNLVTMTSWTGPHVDGVVAQVAIVTPAETPTTDVATDPPETDDFLAFRSAPYSIEIPADELGDLRIAEVIDDSGNGVLLASLRRPPSTCGFGFMNGRWLRTSERGGVFGGVWVQANGRREGYLAARWGVNADGERVFHGKIVNMKGEFLAFMAGTYGDGVYEGEIYGRGRALLGFMRGRYTGGDGHGLFLGGWRQNCENDVPPRTCRLTADGVRVCVTDARPESTP